MWYHNKRFKAWKNVHLQPLVDELVEHAANDPQYDWQYLYSLEYAKLRCMRAYFSHSTIADSNGNFGLSLWIDTCISLLQHMKDDGTNISEDLIKRMNIRNVRDVMPLSIIDDYLKAPVPISQRHCNPSLGRLLVWQGSGVGRYLPSLLEYDVGSCLSTICTS